MVGFYDAIQMLAQPADIQVSLFPEFANITDEMAIDFEDALNSEVFLAEKKNLTDQQLEAIMKLDSFFESVGGEKFIDTVWNNDALHSSKEWEEIRFLASNIIDAMGWTLEKPAKNNAVYIYNGAVYNGASSPSERRGSIDHLWDKLRQRTKE